MATYTMPTRRKLVPWNKGRKVGERIAFEQTHLLQLRQIFLDEGETHDLALFMVGIDTLLRVSDLLRLRVRDIVKPDGTIRAAFPWQQQKTDNQVSPILTPSAATALLNWIEESGKGDDDYLFTRRKPRGADPITDDYYRKHVKNWAEKLGLDRSEYSTHSIRRTKAVFAYWRGGDISIIADLLGHTNTDTVMKYLGIKKAQAHQLAHDHDIWNPKNKPCEHPRQSLRLTKRDYRGIVDEIARRGLLISPSDLVTKIVDEMGKRDLAMSSEAMVSKVVQKLLDTDLFIS